MPIKPHQIDRRDAGLVGQYFAWALVPLYRMNWPEAETVYITVDLKNENVRTGTTPPDLVALLEKVEMLLSADANAIHIGTQEEVNLWPLIEEIRALLAKQELPKKPSSKKR